MTTQPRPTPPLPQGTRCLFPRYFYPGSPNRLPQPVPISSPPSPTPTPPPEPEKPNPKRPEYTSKKLVTNAIADHIQRHGYEIARHDLAAWTIEPQLRTTLNGTTVLELFIDSDNNPVLSWQRTEDNFLQVSNVCEETRPSEWLLDENPRWQYWHQDEWHLDHNPDALEEGCYCWPPWEAISLPLETKMPRTDEQYFFSEPTSSYLYDASQHLTRRIILKAGQAASDYHENSTIAEAIDDLSTEENLRELSLIADAAILDSVQNKARHNLLKNIYHYAWVSRPPYDLRWLPENETHQRHHPHNHKQFEIHQSKLDKRYSLKTPTKRQPDIITATGHANQLLLTEILDEDTINTLKPLHDRFLLEDMHDPGTTIKYHPDTIQAVMRNQKAIASLQKTSPYLATIYVTTFCEPAHAFTHPGQIIRHIKGHYKLTPAQWKILCKLAPEIDIVASPATKYAAHNILRIIRILATANRPEASLRSLKLLAGAEHLHEKNWISPPRGRKDQHRQAWTRTMNAFLAPGGPERHAHQLNRVSDAITGTIRAGQNWGPGNWETMLSREDRWHRRTRQKRAVENGKGTWKPLVEEYRDGKLTISPITSHDELKHAARELDNCLHNYYQDCENRGTRIYTYHLSDHTMVGATELIYTGSRWILGQTETTFEDSKEHRKVIRAAERLLQKHQQAEPARQTTPGEEYGIPRGTP